MVEVYALDAPTGRTKCRVRSSLGEPANPHRSRRDQNILKARSIRNNKLVRIVNKFKNPPNKDVGEGLNTTFQAMRELKLRTPEIIQEEMSVIVRLRHERLGSAEENIILYLRDNAEVNNRIARELCAINDANKMKRVLQDMVEGGVIEPIEGRSKRYAAYRKGKNFPEED